MRETNQETIPDIVGEMRDDARKYNRMLDVEKDFQTRVYHAAAATYVSRMADRIEAAWKRVCDDCPVKAGSEEMAAAFMAKHLEDATKREQGMPEDETIVAECSNCKSFHRKTKHCDLHDAATLGKYKCNGWKLKTTQKNKQGKGGAK